MSWLSRKCCEKRIQEHHERYHHPYKWRHHLCIIIMIIMIIIIIIIDIIVGQNRLKNTCPLLTTPTIHLFISGSSALQPSIVLGSPSPGSDCPWCIHHEFRGVHCSPLKIVDVQLAMLIYKHEINLVWWLQHQVST